MHVSPEGQLDTGRHIEHVTNMQRSTIVINKVKVKVP
jgi:hypothetical protein